MSTRIGIISDTHSTVAPLREALSIFKREGAAHIICAGDIVGYGEDKPEETIALLREHDCLMVVGNHDNVPDTVMDTASRETIQTFFDSLPKKIELTVAGKRIYVVHAHPPEAQHGGIKILDPDGKVVEEKKAQWMKRFKSLVSDVLIIGHTHQVFAEYFDRLLVINPGSTCFNHTCMLLTLPEMTVEIFALSNYRPVIVWNWGIYFQEQQGPKTEAKPE